MSQLRRHLIPSESIIKPDHGWDVVVMTGQHAYRQCNND